MHVLENDTTSSGGMISVQYLNGFGIGSGLGLPEDFSSDTEVPPLLNR